MLLWLCQSWIRLHFGMIQGIVWSLKIFLLAIYSSSMTGFVVILCKLASTFHFFYSEFQDIFDVEHFITSLRDEVRILRELPPRVKRRVNLGCFTQCHQLIGQIILITIIR
jgi:hypothetical protein